MLVGGSFLFMGALPPLQIPNLKTSAAAHERDFAFQSHFFAKIFRKNEPALAIRPRVFGAGMKLTQENTAIARGNGRIRFSERTHASEFLRRHDKKKLMLRFGKKNKFLRLVIAPAGGNGDAILFVNGMTEFAGEEDRGVRIESHAPVDNWSISIHFLPL